MVNPIPRWIRKPDELMELVIPGTILLTFNKDGTMDMRSRRIVALATPTADADAATKAYVDSVGVSDHGALTGLADDDHTQYHTDARGDARYFTEAEHLNVSAGAADAGKPLKLDAAGHVDLSMINDADVDHGLITGLGDDDHTQYHTDARGDARYFTETELDGGQLDNRYFTEAEHLNVSAGAGDAGKPVKLDAAGQIDATMINDADVDHANLTGAHNLTTDIDHDALLNFVANEHVDHAAVILTAGVGISGGGDISASRSFAIDLNELPTDTVIAAGDFIAFQDISPAESNKITFANFEGALNHDSLLGFVANEHIDHSGVSINTATGLTGGGDITASRTLDYDINALTADATPDGAADYVVAFDASVTGHKKVLLNDLPGGGGIKQSLSYGGLWDGVGRLASPNGRPDDPDSAFDSGNLAEHALEGGTVDVMLFRHKGNLSTNNATMKIGKNGTIVKTLTATGGSGTVDVFTGLNISVNQGDRMHIEWDAGATNPDLSVVTLIII